MKTNYLFKARWLQGAASANESKKMQVNPRITPFRFACALDSLACRLRVLPSRGLRMAAMLCMLLTLGVGNVWGTAPTLEDLDFGTPIVDEDFEDCSTTSSTSTNKNVVSLTGFGAFNYVYNNNESNTRAIVSNANGFSTKSLSLSAGSGSPLNVFIDGQTFGSIGAWRVKTTKTSYTQLGIYAQKNGNAIAHADARIYIQNNVGVIKIHDGTNFNGNGTVADLSAAAATIIDICVIYNISGSPKTYGNSISLSNNRAHVYINGTAVMNAGGTAPQEYTIPSTALTGAVFKVLPQATTGNKAYIDDVQVWDELPGAAASCSADPTIGTATINTSFTLTSLTDAVSVSSGTCSPGSDCAWIDYGFAWSLGSTTTPTVSNNKVQVGTSGTATSWATDASHKVQPTSGTTPTLWSVGAAYYIRTYGKNGKDDAEFQYGTAASFTLRSIIFNSNGGSSVGPWYVNSGGTYSAPTAPTKTGYTFGGWYTDNSTFESAVDWTASVSENKTYYAKWTASVYRISLDNESPTTSGSTYVDLTYNSSGHDAIINPKKTGYTFEGYWTGDNGTGTMVINTSGVLQANVTDYTGADGIWTKASTCTLYAKWTINNYSVTWKVDGANYSASGSTSVDHGSHVSTLPTAPDPDDYCGDKFVGWTDEEDGEYVHGTSNLYTTADDFPNATGAQIYYAVFADYDE